MITINTSKKDSFLSQGFRIFFLGGTIFSILSVFLWMLFYIMEFPLPGAVDFPAVKWHAHEMIYGFCMAVIAGFLLTAVTNWTGKETLSNLKLVILFILWLLARILILFGKNFILITTICDLLFMLYLTYAIALPIIQAKQWKQIGILSKIILLFAGNLSFYLGAMGYLTQGINWSIYGGLYLVIGLIITMGRRVIPAFIENGVGYSVKIFNSKLIDRLSLILFLAFFIVEVFLSNKNILPYITGSLFLITSIRLYYWHTAGIWKKPLLWSLFVAFIFIDSGFLLFTLSAFQLLPQMLAIHAFSFGGIGLITLSMMSRVSLGHTANRSIHNPPALIRYAFFCIIAGGVTRVFFPLFSMQHYFIWILTSQILWMIAFGIFIISYALLLCSPGSR